jgi:epoxyqueuosine reductase
VLIAAGNSGNASLVGLVEARLGDQSPLVRAMAVWALSRLALDRFNALRARGDADPDASVRGEWMREAA